jgi:hypothetical protein
MNLVMTLEAHSQEKLCLIQSVAKPSSTVMNLTGHLCFAYLAYRIVRKELFPYILVHLVLPSSFG